MMVEILIDDRLYLINSDAIDFVRLGDWMEPSSETQTVLVHFRSGQTQTFRCDDNEDAKKLYNRFVKFFKPLKID